MVEFISFVRGLVRRWAKTVAVALNGWSDGRLTPNMVTWTGLALHVPIAGLIAGGTHSWWAAGMLVVFGLFDVLDGELARLQGKASEAGMLLDATTDRFKEVLLYSAAAWALAHGEHPEMAAWAAAALGASVCVSYVKAKGEAVVAARAQAIPHHELNRMFQGGWLSFEVRMVILIVGLVANQLAVAMVVVALGAGFTAVQRLGRILRVLR